MQSIRKSIFCSVFLVCSMLVAVPSFAAPKKTIANICRSYRSFNNVLYKFQSSGGIGGHDARTGSCSLIAGRGQQGSFPGPRTLTMYDAKAKAIGTFILYQDLPSAPFTWRYYTTNQSCSNIANAAVRNTHKAQGFISLPRGQCYNVTNLRGRVGFANPG